jgi:DNA adenine methylase
MSEQFKSAKEALKPPNLLASREPTGDMGGVASDGFLPRHIARLAVPPVKCQGIKTKLVCFIAASIRWDGRGRWVEPFLGSGVVLFNLCPERALATDTNKHIIRFYQDIQSGALDEATVRGYLQAEGKRLAAEGEAHYYRVRDRFKAMGDPLDFLFLSRSCFNGVMRFNKKGQFNVPFCRRPQRFSPSYVTKICNQVDKVGRLLQGRDWEFRVADWQSALEGVRAEDYVYCDPPYIGRHADYYNTWGDADAALLAKTVKALPCRYAVSMWQENQYRRNPHIAEDWAECTVRTFSHFYHVGPTESRRNRMTEALILGPVS